MDLIDFAEEYRESLDFSYLKNPHTFYVPGRGSERPTVMLLNEAPSALDNTERKSLAGQPGRVLDQLMALAALSTNPDEIPNVYITNMVKYWPGARSLNGPEIINSLGWVRKEWNILRRPPVIVALGLSPTKCLLGWRDRLSRVVAQPHQIGLEGPTIWPMIHPSHALRTPDIRPACEAHWHAFGEWLQEKGLI